MSTEYGTWLRDTPLILGMMRLLDHPQLLRAQTLAGWISHQVDQGLDVFDHADIYGDGACERHFGKALATAPGLKQKIRVITKAGIVPGHLDTSRWQTKHYRAEADYLRQAIDGALQRLQLEQIDTFLIHRPDPLMDAGAVARVLEQAVANGKISHIGVSNFMPDQWRWLQQHTSLPLVCNQSELSLARADALFNGQHDAMLCDRLRWLAWSPLAGGQMANAVPEDLVSEAREQTGLCLNGLAVAWIRQLPGSPIPVLGSLKQERIAAASAGACTSLPRPLWYRLLEAVRSAPVP